MKANNVLEKSCQESVFVNIGNIWTMGGSQTPPRPAYLEQGCLLDVTNDNLRGSGSRAPPNGGCRGGRYRSTFDSQAYLRLTGPGSHSHPSFNIWRSLEISRRLLWADRAQDLPQVLLLFPHPADDDSLNVKPKASETPPSSNKAAPKK